MNSPRRAMKAGEARAIALDWVEEERKRAGGEVVGAFFAGSINGMADGEDFPPSSDIDICVILAEAEPSPRRIVKREYRGIAIEPFYLPRERFLSAEAALADFALACHVAAPSAIFDPRGIIASLKAAMGDRHDSRYWIMRRCLSVRDHSLAVMSRAEGSEELSLLNGVFLHAAQGMAQMYLLADLRVPTVKKSLVNARGVLEHNGMEDAHRELLSLVGSDRLDARDARRMADDCAQALLEAIRVFKTPFGSDNAISVHMIPSIEIEARERIEAGYAGEIALWIAFLHSLSMHVIETDSEARSKGAFHEAYIAAMSPLGLESVAAARERLAAARPFFDTVLTSCERIAAMNPRARGGFDDPG